MRTNGWSPNVPQHVTTFHRSRSELVLFSYDVQGMAIAIARLSLLTIAQQVQHTLLPLSRRGRFKVSEKCKLLNGQATHGSLPDLGVLNSKKVNQSITVHTPRKRIHMDTHTTTTHHCIPNDSECVCLIGFLLPLLLLLHPLVKLFLLLLPCPEGSF